jgi:hypothetical protein
MNVPMAIFGHERMGFGHCCNRDCLYGDLHSEIDGDHGAFETSNQTT